MWTPAVSEVGGIIDTLSLSANEKKQIRSTIVDTLYRYASELEKEQAAIIRTEAQGNWLQKSWRPMKKAEPGIKPMLLADIFIQRQDIAAYQESMTDFQ